MWVLQEVVDASEVLRLTAEQRGMVLEHMATVGLWGVDFSNLAGRALQPALWAGGKKRPGNGLLLTKRRPRGSLAFQILELVGLISPLFCLR